METVTPKPAKKARFVVSIAALYVFFFTCAMAVMDRHRYGHFAPPRQLAVLLAISAAIGVFMGFRAFHRLQKPRKQRSPAQVRIQWVLFVALMLGLMFALWKMW
jgi:hypothetical protein